VTKANQSKPRHHVLLVDDDRDFLAAAADAFAWLGDNTWEIHIATDSAQALAAVVAGKIQLVVLDAKPADSAATELIGQLRQRQPDLKIAVLAGAATEATRVVSLAAGADLFLEKPLSPEGLKAAFENFCELLGCAVPPPNPAARRNVGLTDLIQIECQAGNSSVVEIFREHSLGRIYIELGQIVHAVCGEFSGETAFQKLLTVAGGTFELRDFELPPERTLNRTWEYLLAEAARQRELSDLRARTSGTVAGDDVSTEPAGRASELLICGGDGETLYQWQCTDAAARLKLLQNIAHRAGALVLEIQLGKLDRLEIQLADGRAVLQPRADRLIFARLASPSVK
jgi:ActR/RegA family two-component response regulator